MIKSAGYVGNFPSVWPIFIRFNSTDDSDVACPIVGSVDVAMYVNSSPTPITEDIELSTNWGNVVGLNMAHLYVDSGLAAGEYTVVLVGGECDGKDCDGQIVGSFSVGR